MIVLRKILSKYVNKLAYAGTMQNFQSDSAKITTQQ